MTRFKLFRLRSAMIFSNLISNMVGVCVVLAITRRPATPSSYEIVEISQSLTHIFVPCAFVLPFLLTLIYEKPIRRYLNAQYLQMPLPEGLELKARQRLLNEPYFLIALDLAVWCFAAILYPLVFWAYGAGDYTIRYGFFVNLYTGLITTTVAFFVFEFVLQRRLAFHFFPDGGLFMTPKTLRIRIRARLAALLLACNLVPLIAILNIVEVVSVGGQDPMQVLNQMQSSVLLNATIFMGVGIWVTFLVSSNLTRPLKEIIRVLRAVRHGQFDQRVQVTSNDEIGYTGDVINEMNRGLRERDFIKETFGKYVTSEIRDEILSGRVSLDGELKAVTVLFADLRNFTPMVESTSPKEVVKIINEYFGEMAEAIQGKHGLVLQFIGDEIEAVFGAPLFMEDHPGMAVEAAQEMQRRLRTLNQKIESRGYVPLSHGIGIHTGEVLAANIGSPERLSYALVGDTVNLASRLQGLNKEFGTEIIISGSTRAHLGDHYEWISLPPTMVKGKSQPVEIFTLGMTR